MNSDFFLKNLRRYWQLKVCTAGKFTAGIVGTVGKFTAGISDISGYTFPDIYNDCNVLTPSENLPPVSANLKKNRKGTTRSIRGPEEDDSWNNLKLETSWHCPFKFGWQSLKLCPAILCVLHYPKVLSFMVLQGPSWSFMVHHGP